MQVRQTNNGEVEIIIPKGTYHAHLQKIGDVIFTLREIDVIACILSGRSAKKIASLLAISPKTVENHIRNIMLKLGCRSQESIIDFIERSGKFAIVKQYYSDLLVESLFDQTLINIINLIREKGLSYSVVYHKEQKDKSAHLVLNGKRSLDLHTELKAIGTDPNSEERHHYFFTFDLIKKLFPELDIDPYILEFSKQYKTIDETDFKNVRTDSHSIDEVLENIAPTNIQGLEFQRLQSKHKNSSKQKLVSLRNTTFFTFMFLIFAFLLYSNINSDVERTIIKPRFLSNLLVKIAVKKAPTWNLPRQDHIFVGRDSILAALFVKLHNNPKTTNIASQDSNGKNLKVTETNTLAISACAGLGGIGKTQLALQYAHHAKYSYTVRAWFPAENIDQLNQKYIEFAKELGSEENISAKKAIGYVKEWLAKNPGWLLIYDNVNSYEEIADFLPEKGGYVLITTRAQTCAKPC